MDFIIQIAEIEMRFPAEIPNTAQTATGVSAFDLFIRSISFTPILRIYYIHIIFNRAEKILYYMYVCLHSRSNGSTRYRVGIPLLWDPSNPHTSICDVYSYLFIYFISAHTTGSAQVYVLCVCIVLSALRNLDRSIIHS